MSGIEIATRRLTADAGVTAITTKNRIYPIAAPQNAQAPYIVVNLVGAIDEKLIETSGKYRRERIDVSCISTGASEVIDLGNAVLAAFDNVIKQAVAGFHDVDILFADVDITASNDERSAFQRDLQFFIRWR